MKQAVIRYVDVHALGLGFLEHLPATPHAHRLLCFAEKVNNHQRETKKQTRTKSKYNVHLRHRSLNQNARTVVCLHFQFCAKTPGLCRHVPTDDVIIRSPAYHFQLHGIMNF